MLHCDVDRVRLQVPVLVLPRPECVLESAGIPAPVDSPPSEAHLDPDRIEALVQASADWPLVTAPLQALIDHALGRSVGESIRREERGRQRSASAEDAHDGYFRIERAQAPEGPHYLRAIVGGLDLLLQEAASTDELKDYESIGLAMLDLWLAALGRPQAGVLPVVLADMHQRAPDPVRRWVRGHQIFAVITQGLIWTLHRFEHALERDDDDALRDSLRRLARLFRASAAAFRFTADFDPAFYEQAIRPSMSEPHLPAGFSGTLSVDHGHLVSLLKDLRLPLGVARARCPGEYLQMTEALAQVYDDHKWVCARFTGPSATSLLTSSAGGERAATDMLDKFKARRVGSLLN
jgi:hypothetical protein